MRKQTIKFAVESKNGIVTNIGKSTIYQPAIKFQGESVKWLMILNSLGKQNK